MRTSTARRRPRIASAVIAGVLMMSVACADDDADDPPAAADPDEGATPGDVATAEIVIADFVYSDPGPVPVGTTVTVRNDDTAQHTWTSVDGVFDSGALGSGETFSFTFDEPGEYPFICSFHPTMGSTLVVTG